MGCDWEITTLEQVSSVLGDGLHGTPTYSDNGKYYFINGNNLSGGAIVFKNDTKCVDVSEYEKYKKPLCNRTIFVSINGTIGNVGIYNGENCILGKSACYFNINESIDKMYVYYVVISRDFQEYIRRLATGTTIKNVSLKTMREYKFSLPPLPEQKAIAAVLSALDDKIELNNRINKTLEEMAQAIFKSWFVDFEPFQDGEFVESELGLIPKGWRVGTLGEIADITMGQSPNGSSYNEHRDGIVFYQGRAEFGWRFPTQRLFTTEPNRLAKENDILMSVRAPVGDINIAWEDCCLGRGLSALHSKNECASFLLYTMFVLKRNLEVFNGEGTVFGSINKDSLHGMKVMIPCFSQMKKFESIISPTDRLIKQRYLENCNLQVQRNTPTHAS